VVAERFIFWPNGRAKLAHVLECQCFGERFGQKVGFSTENFCCFFVKARQNVFYHV
jgi:hypothetical protein